jgi:hypothetical protein
MEQEWSKLCELVLSKGLRVILREKDGCTLYLKLWCGEVKAIETYGDSFSSETVHVEQARKLFKKHEQTLRFAP